MVVNPIINTGEDDGIPWWYFLVAGLLLLLLIGTVLTIIIKKKREKEKVFSKFNKDNVSLEGEEFNNSKNLENKEKLHTDIE